MTRTGGNGKTVSLLRDGEFSSFPLFFLAEQAVKAKANKEENNTNSPESRYLILIFFIPILSLVRGS